MKLTNKSKTEITETIIMYQNANDQLNYIMAGTEQPEIPDIDVIVAYVASAIYRMLKANQATVDGVNSELGYMAIRLATKHNGLIDNTRLTDNNIKTAVDDAQAQLMADVMADSKHMNQSDVDDMHF